MTMHSHSIKVDLRGIKAWGKDFKLITDLIRSGVKNEHGFAALKGLTDIRFEEWPIAVRFKTADSRAKFYSRMQRLLNPKVIKKIGLKSTSPNADRSKPVRYLRS